MKQGYLFKLGDGPINFKWNKRYCVLQDQSFSYFSNPKEKNPRGVLNLREAGISQIHHVKGHDYSFTIQLANKKWYHFSDRDLPEVEEWRNTLINIIYSQNVENSQALEEPDSGEETNLRDVSFMEQTIKPTPDYIVEEMKHIRKLCNDENNWNLYSVKDGVKVFVYKYRAFKPMWKPVCVVLCILLLIFPLLYQDIRLSLIGIVASLYGAYVISSKEQFLKQRFKFAKSVALVPDTATEVFSYLQDANLRQLWDPMVCKVNREDGTNDFSDAISFEIIPPRDSLFAYRSKPLKVSGPRVWCKDGEEYCVVTKCDAMYEGFYIRPLGKTNCTVQYVVSLTLDQPKRQFRLFEEIMTIAKARAISGLKEFLLEQVLDTPENGQSIRGYQAQTKNRIDDYVLYNDGTVPLQHRLYTDYLRDPAGGIVCKNKPDLASQKGIIVELLKKAGKQLMEGKHIVGVSLPVRIFEPRSTLERMVDWWWTAPVYLTNAARETNPLERIKHVVCFCVSGLHYGTRQLKPFNPILGETYQGQFADGTDIFIEHTSHHPPRAHFQVENPDYIYTGHYEFTAAVKGNSVIGRQKGPNIVKFNDGGCIEFKRPPCRIGGLIYGKRILEYQQDMEFWDVANDIYCKIEFSSRGSLLSRNKMPSDFFHGSITQQGTTLSDIRGNYLESLAFNGKEYWILEQTPVYKGIPHPDPLPSDCRFREDMIMLGRGLNKEAEAQKIRLEVLQRADRTLRQAAEKIDRKSRASMLRSTRSQVKSDTAIN